MAEGITALFCMGFLAGVVIATFVLGVIALLKNKKAENNKNGQRVNRTKTTRNS